MTTTIAVAGKGGTGKTSIAALLIAVLAEKNVVLAIDADPSSNLNMALGMPLSDTVGDVREEMLAAVRKGTFEAGVAKREYFELGVNQALVESNKIDLLAMGRPEGPGCYCAANTMLRACIDRMARNYDYVVIDNEAGMEHISRQTTRDVDVLLLVSDPSMRGVTAAIRMKGLIAELRTHVGKVGLVINRDNGSLSSEVTRAVEESGLELIARLPEDSAVGELDAVGLPLTELPADSPMRTAVAGIATGLGIG